MKTMCDVCKREEAVVFCCADEAALCALCDDQVHLTNKLFVKHRRLSLHSLSPIQFPLCDICQKKRALFFCREDRALFCCDCDSFIHGANDFTKKHARFLFSSASLSFTDAPVKRDTNDLSISDYLVKELELPGWSLEDFLDEEPSIIRSAKIQEEDLNLFPEEDVDDGSLLSLIKVPRRGNNQRRRCRRLSDDGFTVPGLVAGESRSHQKRQRETVASLRVPDGGGPFFPSLFFV